MRRTLQLVLLFGLGGLSTLAFILGAEPFGVPGRNPIGERLGGSVAVAVFFAVSQFFVARRDATAGTSSWSSVTVMLSGLATAGALVIAREGREQWQVFVAPALLAALVGAAVGVTVGRRTKRLTCCPAVDPAPCSRSGTSRG